MDIQVNASEWNGITADVRDKIQSIIKSHFPDTTIVGSDNARHAEEALGSRTIQGFNFTNPLCTAACGVAEAAAVAACSALSGGVAIAVCVAAAHEAGNFCRSRC